MGRYSAVFTAVLAIPWLAGSLQGQVSSRVTVARPAPGAVRGMLPTPVATAPVAELLELNIPSGEQLFVRENAKLFGYNSQPIISPGSSFRREMRNGRLALVETRFEVVYENRYGMNLENLKPTTELIHPGDSKLLYTGPWGGGWTSESVVYIYLFRPVESPPRVARSRARTASFAELNGGTLAVTQKSASPRVVASPRSLLPSTADCGVPVAPQGGGGSGNLVCLLLNDGQGMTLPSGIRLFRRQLVTEVWSGDKLLTESYGLVVRDGSNRHWLLEGKGYR